MIGNIFNRLPEKKELTKIPLPQLKILIMVLVMPTMFPWTVSAARLGALVEGMLKFKRISLERSTCNVMGRKRFRAVEPPRFSDKSDQLGGTKRCQTGFSSIEDYVS